MIIRFDCLLLSLACCLAGFAFGEPISGKAKFSFYCVAEVSPKEGGGIPGKVLDPDGKWRGFRLSPTDTRNANMEGTVSVVDEKGVRQVASIVEIGRWAITPDGWEGRGNRENPLVSYRMVAADLGHHPYGSRLHIPATVGYVTPDGRTLDGWFWVADKGGGIKGRMRFDVFVGAEAHYLTHMKTEEGHWTDTIRIEHPPSVPAKYDPRRPAGVEVILTALGYRIDTSLDALKELPSKWDEPVALGTALTDFQRQHPEIPELEHGTRIGAITQWFLHQAGIAVSKKQEYPAKRHEVGQNKR